MRAKAELRAAVGDQGLDPFEHRVDMAFAEPIGVKALQLDRRLGAAAGEEARNDLLFEHAVQFARHPGSKEKPSLAGLHRTPASGRPGRRHVCLCWLRADIGESAIDDLPGEDFGAGADDLDEHVWSHAMKLSLRPGSGHCIAASWPVAESVM